MINLIKSEFFKLKRSKLFLIVILGSIAPSTFMFLGLVIGNVGPITMGNFLEEINLYSLMLFNVVVFTLLEGYLIVREYNEHTLKAILTIPISKTNYIFGKFLVFELLVVFLTLFTYALSIFFGCIGGASDISINVLGEYFVKFLAGNILLSISITPFILISLVFKNIVPIVIGGVVVSLSNSIVFGNSYGALSPFCTPILLVTNELSNCGYGTFTPLTILLLTCIVGLVCSIIYFNKIDVTL